MAKKPADTGDRIIAAAMKLAAERGWKALSMGDIAAAARQPLSEVYRHYPAKIAILDGFTRQIDQAVLDGVDKDKTQGDGSLSEEDPRDRLFDVLMRRFDALAPHKKAIREIARDLRRSPLTALATTPQGLRSMAWMLVAAGIPADGLRGLVRVEALCVVWLATMRVWMHDDDPDVSRAMAALDRNLRRMFSLCGLARRRRAGGEPAPKEAA